MKATRNTLQAPATVSLSAAPGMTILEALEAVGFQPDYGCRQGFCGACRAKLVKGRVRYCNPPLAWTETGEILPCVCQPVTDVELQTAALHPTK